jgi:DICT domain-containing protein
VAPTEALVRAVRLSETDERFDAGERPALLEYVERGGYAVDNGGKRYLVGVSRMIEERARRVGRGELHTGFQSLARLDDERGTRRMYDALAATDVDVHLYGVDDGGAADALADQFTVHPAEAAELAESWFVVFDGGGVTDAAVSLLTEERDPGRYHGFWSRDVDLTGRIVRYLETTYGG